MTESQLTTITTAVHALEASFHALQLCPPSKRKRTPTIGRNREQFAAIALEAGRQFEALMPRDLEMEEVAAIRHERLRLQALRQKVRHLSALLDGHLHAVGHADYQNCTRIYRMLRAATHVEGHDLDSTLDALGKSYSEKRGGVVEEEAGLEDGKRDENPTLEAGKEKQDPDSIGDSAGRELPAHGSPHQQDREASSNRGSMRINSSLPTFHYSTA